MPLVSLGTRFQSSTQEIRDSIGRTDDFSLEKNNVLWNTTKML